MLKINIEKKLHGANGEMYLKINLSVKKGEFLALAGESGSGKTTLLRILAGLEPSTGTVSIDNEVWQDENFRLAPQKRKIGFVFQDYALFENMSVEKNLLFVKKNKLLAHKLLEITELTALKKRLPHTLSGGQKQRLSLCRAMMNQPKLLLMDEPLSALDPTMRNTLQEEILLLHQEFGTTTIMVSHDPSEMYKMASRVVVLKLGKIVNDGTAKEILLKTNGSQKFSFEGELLEIIEVDVIYIAIIAIGQQLIEVVLSENERKGLTIGEKVRVGTKAFAPTLSH